MALAVAQQAQASPAPVLGAGDAVTYAASASTRTASLIAPEALPLAAKSSCGFRSGMITQKLVRISRNWRSDTGILRPRRYGRKGDVHRAMPEVLVLRLLRASWRAFGATPEQAQRYSVRNLNQIRGESALIPYILQSRSLHGVNQHNPAGGLFQFIPESFSSWQLARHYGDRFNPLGNILAAVNAQVNADYIYAAVGRFPGGILDGRHGGWGMSGLNPC
jgi:hypothetical protein